MATTRETTTTGQRVVTVAIGEITTTVTETAAGSRGEVEHHGEVIEEVRLIN